MVWPLLMALMSAKQQQNQKASVEKQETEADRDAAGAKYGQWLAGIDKPAAQSSGFGGGRFGAPAATPAVAAPAPAPSPAPQMIEPTSQPLPPVPPAQQPGFGDGMQAALQQKMPISRLWWK